LFNNISQEDKNTILEMHSVNKNIISEQTMPDCQPNSVGTLVLNNSNVNNPVWTLKLQTGFCKIPPVPRLNYHVVPGMCFISGTLVSMSDGTQLPIEKIKEGDEVLSFEDRKTIVSELEIHLTSKLSIITLSNNNVIKTTEVHPFYVKDKGLSVISPDIYEDSYGDKLPQLIKGDLLITVDGENFSIETIESVTLDSEVEVYNLGLNGEENYYANDILVGN
jgi:hypothetical protein